MLEDHYPDEYLEELLADLDNLAVEPVDAPAEPRLDHEAATIRITRYLALWCATLDRYDRIEVPFAEAKRRFTEARKARNKEARRIKDRDDKREKRGKTAATVRPYQWLDDLTSEERADRKRAQDNTSKQKQRQNAKRITIAAKHPLNMFG